MEKFQIKVSTQNNQIYSFLDEVTNLKKKVAAHEKFRSKDVYVHNFQFDALSQSLEADVSRAIEFVFENKVTTASFKACYPLWKKFFNGGVVALVIFKFLYFWDNYAIHGKRKMLAGS